MLKKPTLSYIAEVGAHALTVCLPNTSEPLVVSYPEGAVENMELRDSQKLFESLTEGFKNVQPAKSEIILIFGDDLCFVFDLTGVPVVQQDIHFASFLETVPFESVMAKKIKYDEKRAYMAAINRQLYDFFRSFLASKGMEVVAVVPAIIAKNLGYDGQVNKNVCSILFKKINQLKTFSFITEYEDHPQFVRNQRHFINKHQNFFAVLSLVFVLLCGVTAYTTLRRPAPVKSNTRVIPPVTETAISPTTEPTPTEIPLEAIKIQILGDGRARTAITQLQTNLKNAGYVDVVSQTASVSARTAQIGFSTRTPGTVRENITALVQGLFTDVVIRDVDADEYDVTIITSNSLKNTP